MQPYWFTATKNYEMDYPILDEYRVNVERLKKDTIFSWLLIKELLEEFVPAEIYDMIFRIFCKRYQIDIIHPGIILSDNGKDFSLTIDTFGDTKNTIIFGDHEIKVCVFENKFIQFNEINFDRETFVGICFVNEIVSSNELRINNEIKVKDCFPSSITKLIYGKYYTQPVTNTIPLTITSIQFPSRCSFSAFDDVKNRIMCLSTYPCLTPCNYERTPDNCNWSNGPIKMSDIFPSSKFRLIIHKDL